MAVVNIQAAFGKARTRSSSLAGTFTVARIRRVGFVLLALELLGFFYWSTVVYGHFDLTADAALHFQAWFLIAHGHLFPYSSSGQEYYIQDHAEVLIWLFAPLYWIYPSGVVLLWLQDIIVVLAELVALLWICEVCDQLTAKTGPDALLDSSGRTLPWWWPSALATLGVLLLVGNPWYLYGLSFDFHMIAFGGCFALLTAYDIAHGNNKRCWLWAVLTAMCGDASATYLAGVALSAI